MTTITSDPADTNTRIAASLERRAERSRAAAGKRGPVSFYWGDFVTEPGTEVHGAPGTWAPRPNGEPGLVVTARAEDGIRIGRELVDGEAVLHWDASTGPAVAEFPDGAEGIVFSYDGTKHALQVWNPASEWAKRYAGIAAYDIDPAWVIPATVTLVDSDRTVAISHHRDPRPIDVPVVAEIRIAVGGQERVLLGTAAPGLDGIIVLFRDATNGAGSYGAGRTLYLPERRAGATEVDFNEAVLLPCAFSLAWNCPIPPAENALSFPVLAGERFAIDHDGRELL